jgi:cytochrome c biogenesis protein
MKAQVQTIAKAGTAPAKTVSGNWLDVALKFLSSVQFGIALMITLALAMILGTFIVQLPMAEPGQIEQLYAPQTRKIFDALGLFDVFHSTWFITLLGLLCLNITFASIDRFPGTWQFLRHPQKDLDEKSIETLPLNALHTLEASPPQVEKKLCSVFRELGLHTMRSTTAGRTVIFGEKGKYSRLAVYAVHLSLLLILLGAMIDSILGFRGYLSLAEGEGSDRVELGATNSTLQLPFQIRCDATGVEHYADGTPRKWWSDLVILQNGREASRKHILVNDPMDYGGIRIFQSSFGSSGEPREFGLTLRAKDRPESAPVSFRLRPGEKLQLEEQGVSLSVLQFLPDFAMHGSEFHSHSNEPNNPALQLELTGPDGGRWKSWVFQKRPDFHPAGELPFDLRFESVRMKPFTGLQIARQPGQNVIWAGCFLMVAGLMVSFYSSHQRFWGLMRTSGHGETALWLGASSSKNKLALERRLRELEQKLTA